MTFEEYYQDSYPALQQAEKTLLGLIREYPVDEAMGEVQPILYCTSRIKSPESMIGKLIRMGLPADKDTAVAKMHDAVGIRIICSFPDNVYEVAEWLGKQEGIEVTEQKDYMSHPKPNGYRSLHLILSMEGKSGKMLAEVQIRTIAIDFWAALEHQIKYKHEVKHTEIIQHELKRCADEIASLDMSMQTIRDMIREGE